MATPSASTLEECRKLLVPVLLALAQARDPATRPDPEQFPRLLSDDHCKHFFQHARATRLQLSSLASQKTPHASASASSPSLKRDRVDDAHVWRRNTRSRFDGPRIALVSDVVSRQDSETPSSSVDIPGVRSAPKAPRAMLQASNHRTDEALVASPTAEELPGSPSSTELLGDALKMFPALVPTQPTTDVDPSSVSVGRATGGHPSQPVSLTRSPSTDFVSRLPTYGIWFKQQGRPHAEIVDVDIDVSRDMFFTSTECRLFRMRTHLRICSVPGGADGGEARLALEHIDAAVKRGALRWPKKGKLVVQVNPGSERGKTWLPYTLESRPLDVTSCVRPGKNTFRFIQLSDLSDFSFVLAASPSPVEEEWRSWDWSSIFERSRTTPPSTDDPTNVLSEFAHVPVTVRS